MTKPTNMTNWRPVFEDLLKVYDKHKVPLNIGSAIFAYALGYSRGLQQKSIMDMVTVENINLGWQDGASVETADFITEGEEPKS